MAHVVVYYRHRRCLLNPCVSDAPRPPDRRVKFLAFLVRVGLGPAAGRAQAARARRRRGAGASHWPDITGSSETQQDTEPSDDIARHFTINNNISERKALWPWYEWSTRSLSHLHPHSIVVQLLWAHQPPAPVLWTALAHSPSLGCWDREARLFTKHSLHGKFLLLHSHGCQEVSPVILLVLIALRASVSSLVRDIRSIPNPVSHSIILSLSRQDKGGSSLENILRILIPELNINYWLGKLVKYLGYEMLDQSIERNMNCWISISNTLPCSSFEFVSNVVLVLLGSTA